MESQEVSMLRVWGPCSLLMVLAGSFLITGCALGPPLFGPAMRDVLESLFLIALIGMGVSFAIKWWTRDGRSRSLGGAVDTPRAEDLAKARYVRGELTLEDYLKLLDDLR